MADLRNEMVRLPDAIKAGLTIIAACFAVLGGVSYLSGRLTNIENTLAQVQKTQSELKANQVEMAQQITTVERNQSRVMFTLKIPQEILPGSIFIDPPPIGKADPAKKEGHSLVNPFAAGVTFNQVPPQNAGAERTLW